MEENKRPKAFSLPRMNIDDVFWYDKEEILKDLMEATTMLISYRTKDGESRFLFSGLGEGEFKLFASQVHRLIPLYEFMKSIIQYIDKMRQCDISGQQHLIEVINYLKYNSKKI